MNAALDLPTFTSRATRASVPLETGRGAGAALDRLPLLRRVAHGVIDTLALPYTSYLQYRDGNLSLAN